MNLHYFFLVVSLTISSLNIPRSIQSMKEEELKSLYLFMNIVLKMLKDHKDFQKIIYTEKKMKNLLLNLFEETVDEANCTIIVQITIVKFLL